MKPTRSNDERFTSQFTGAASHLPGLNAKPLKFVPFSKFPICYKDVSFWHPDRFHDNDLSEIVRSVAGDLAEDVKMLSSFTHPKTGRSSRLYRISYRY